MNTISQRINSIVILYTIHYNNLILILPLSINNIYSEFNSTSIKIIQSKEGKTRTKGKDLRFKLT